MTRRSPKQFIKRSAESGLSLNIRNPKCVPLPPSISASAFNEHGGFDPETVVSRNADGSIASRFKDPIWKFSALCGMNSRWNSMQFIDNEALAYEVKTLILLVMLTPVSPQVLMDRYCSFCIFLNSLAKVCDAEAITLKNLFNNQGGNRLFNIIKNNKPFHAKNMIVISNYLHFMAEEVGFEHGYNSFGKSAQVRLRKVFHAYAAEIKQTPVIPSRILKAIYHDAISEYEALLPVLDELLVMQTEIDSHPMVGLARTSQEQICREYCGITFSQLTVSYPTNYDLAKKYPLAREFLNRKFNNRCSKQHKHSFEFVVAYHRHSVLYAINYIQRVCQDIIIMFTGMRPLEVQLLPYFGSKETFVDGVKYWLIYGFAVKKRRDTLPFEMWVTNEYGYRAFQTAKRIADLYYTRNQRQSIETLPDGELTPELSPLFLRDNGQIDQRNFTMKKTACQERSYAITKDDFNEMKMIDPHRIWEGEPEFAIGKPFPVELRLFRRSIAFFASASGVRLVDMKNQLHHLFESQTFYYGQGSGRANPFLNNKDSFASYFNQVKHEAEAFGFINEVINFDGKLFGASATYAERNQMFYSTIRDEDRTETVKRFERGELSYTETHLGGCKTLTPCKKKALGSVTACLSCKDADIKPEKLAYAIKDQAEFVDRLNPKRLEWRTEIHELIIMLDFAIKNINNAIESLDRRKDEYKQFSKWRKEFKQMRKSYLKIIEDNHRAA